MKKNFKTITVCLVLVAMAAVVTGCDNGNEVVDMLPEKKNIILSSQQQLMANANNEFAWKLFQTVREQEGENSFIVSPLSATFVLGMLNDGAADETRDEIVQALGFGDNPQGLNEFCKKLIDEAPGLDKAATLRIANCVNVNSAVNCVLLEQFINNMKQYYNAPVNALDFTNSKTLSIINDWCKKNTDGMIPSILDKIKPDDAMYFLNAIYFSADWTEKFNPNDTRDEVFTMPNGTTKKKPLMHRKANAMCCQSDLCDMLCLPFGSNAYRMYFLLPAEGHTIAEVADQLNVNDLNDYFNVLRPHEVDILVPRFETTSKIRLDASLKAMGINAAFNPSLADFSNMANRGLFVSEITQCAKILVNENGAKASAVTIAVSGETSAGPPQEYTKSEFHATRPFLYFIMEESTRSLFFIGAYCGN